MIVAVVNQKGGVGKTTTALNLAAAFATKGARVLLVDLDAQANASSFLDVRAVDSIYDALVDTSVSLAQITVKTPIPNLDLAPGHRALAGLDSALGHELGKEFLLRELLETRRDDYDMVFVDTAPAPHFSPGGVGAGMALVAADIALVPLACEEIVVEGLAQVSQSIQKAQKRLNPQLGMRIALTMADNRRADSKTIEDATRKRFGQLVYQTVIPRLAEVSRGLSHRSEGGAVVSFAPKSAGALAYCALAEEVARG